jgi:hypothetical protein
MIKILYEQIIDFPKIYIFLLDLNENCGKKTTEKWIFFRLKI